MKQKDLKWIITTTENCAYHSNLDEKPMLRSGKIFIVGYSHNGVDLVKYLINPEYILTLNENEDEER